MRDYIGADSDGPSRSEEEKDTKWMRLAPTTPRSERGAHPNDYDQVMGVTSMGSRDSVRFREENDPETEDVPNEGVRDTANLDETLDNDLYHDANPGAGETQGGYGSAGSASLVECLRLGAETTSATCHSGESSRDTRSFPADPSHFYSVFETRFF